jgi:hypothetical protein
MYIGLLIYIIEHIVVVQIFFMRYSFGLAINEQPRVDGKPRSLGLTLLGTRGSDRRRKRQYRTAVSFGMQCEMIGSGKRTAADVAVERTITGVFSYVSSQLVRSRETPLAIGPFARVGLLTCKRPKKLIYTFLASLRKRTSIN